MEKEENDEPDKKISIVEEARMIRDEIIKAKEDLQIEREALEKIRSEQLLSGTSGGHIEAKVIPEDQRISTQAADFFKDTALGDAITKTNG